MGLCTKLDSQINTEGQRLSETFAVKEARSYYEHLTTEYGLTVGPIFDSEWVYFGALDIDKYQLTEEETKRLIGGANRNMLVCRLNREDYTFIFFASEKIPAN